MLGHLVVLCDLYSRVNAEQTKADRGCKQSEGSEGETSDGGAEYWDFPDGFSDFSERYNFASRISASRTGSRSGGPIRPTGTPPVR